VKQAKMRSNISHPVDVGCAALNITFIPMVVHAFRSFCQAFYLHQSLGSLGFERSPK